MPSKRKNPILSHNESNENDEVIVHDSNIPKWYVIQTYTGFEDAVARLIQQKVQTLSLQDKILEMYSPSKKVTEMDAKGNRKEKNKKVHPGYLYIYAILDREVGYAIQNTQYVSRIPGVGKSIIPLDDGYIENLKQKLADEEQATMGNLQLKLNLGDIVVVGPGHPFESMEGRICEIDTQGEKISVLLSIFDRETRVDLDILQVRKK